MMLDEIEMVERNLELTRNWLHYVLEHPESLERLPDAAYLFDLPFDDPDLLAANLQIATEIAWQMGQDGEEKRPIVLLPQ
jgi:hypothetical protein